MISAGELDKRLTLQSKTVTTNSFGEEVPTWTDIASFWAGKKLLTIKDVSKQQGQADQAEIKFLIRHRTDISTAMRVTYRDQIYYITAIEELLDGTGLFLFVRQS